jgi:phage-related protein
MDIQFYYTRFGNSPVEKLILAMPSVVREDLFLTLDRLARGENLTMPLSRPLFDIALGLHELRFRHEPNIYRVFYYIKRGDAIYIVHAIQKKTQQIALKDRRLILKRLKEIL